MQTTTRIGMPLAEFIEATNDQVFELINGERKPRLPTVAGHNFVLHLIYQFLVGFLVHSPLGEVFMEATFILPEKYDADWVEGSRTPDALFFTAERINAYRQQHPDWRQKPYMIVPDLVVEVVSPTDRVSDLDEKIDAYLADGVRLIWVLNPQRRKAMVYSPDQEQPLQLKADGVLDGEDVLPGFQLPLARLFES